MVLTHQPDAFVETQPIKAAYLRPPADAHIGRANLQARLKAVVEQLVAGHQ